MSTVINTNMGSLNAVRLLDQSSRSQATTMERLTSGIRLNSSKDDAAGLAVTTGMTSQIRGLDMAVRNTNDGIALTQTMDGASEEIVSMMQRMRELAVQSLNGTYSAENRAQMNTEFDALKTELGRVADTTKFNGLSVLNNEGEVTIQAGWQSDIQDKINIETMDFNTAVKTNKDAVSGFQAAATGAGIDAEGDYLAVNVGATALGQAVSVRLEFGKTYDGVTIDESTTQNDVNKALAYAINNNADLQSQGFIATVVSNKVSLSSVKFDLVAADLAAGTSIATNGSDTTAVAAATAGAVATSKAIEIAGLDTVENATKTIAYLDGTMSIVNDYRAKWGATMNRLDYTVSNLQNISENTSAARSRIQDTDYAKEAANLARTQVLQQAGMSMLSQANQMTQNALSLLK